MSGDEKKTSVFIQGISGRIIEAGRWGDIHSVRIDCGKGQVITLSGISETHAQQFASNLFNLIDLRFDAQEEGS